MSEITISAKKLTWHKKFIGLIGKDKPEAIYFETRWGIHTFGLKFPIDVVILDENNKVVVVKKSLKQNSLFFWNPKYSRVLELSSGFIRMKKSDKIKII